MKLIALMGKSGCGKNALADLLLAHDPRGRQLAFADKLKQLCMDLYGLSHADCYTEAGKARTLNFPCYKCPLCGALDTMTMAPTEVRCKACDAGGTPDAFTSHWTVRMVLQYVGTEGTRRIDDLVWVKQALREAATTPEVPYVVITDCRFRSEADAIWAAGGEVWRIRRPTTDRQGTGIKGHPSETEMDTIPDTLFQQVINNDTTLATLQSQGIAALHQALAH